MSTLSERTAIASARIPERPREVQKVALVLVDGTEVHGSLHRSHGQRTLDVLNGLTEGFMAVTGATLIYRERVERVPFVAINKAHVVRVTESDDAA